MASLSKVGCLGPMGPSCEGQQKSRPKPYSSEAHRIPRKSPVLFLPSIFALAFAITALARYRFLSQSADSFFLLLPSNVGSVSPRAVPLHLRAAGSTQDSSIRLGIHVQVNDYVVGSFVFHLIGARRNLQNHVFLSLCAAGQMNSSFLADLWWRVTAEEEESFSSDAGRRGSRSHHRHRAKGGNSSSERAS